MLTWAAQISDGIPLDWNKVKSSYMNTTDLKQGPHAYKVFLGLSKVLSL